MSRPNEYWVRKNDKGRMFIGCVHFNGVTTQCEERRTYDSARADASSLLARLRGYQVAITRHLI